MARNKNNWKKQIKNTHGSSIISVMVAFVILLIGIAGLRTAVRTASNLVRRAETLNAATGMVVKEFYQKYPARVDWAEQNMILPVYEANKDGTPTGGSLAFNLGGSLNQMDWEADPSGDGSAGDSGKITFTMYYYK